MSVKLLAVYPVLTKKLQTKHHDRYRAMGSCRSAFDLCKESHGLWVCCAGAKITYPLPHILRHPFLLFHSHLFNYHVRPFFGYRERQRGGILTGIIQLAFQWTGISRDLTRFDLWSTGETPWTLDWQDTGSKWIDNPPGMMTPLSLPPSREEKVYYQ